MLKNSKNYKNKIKKYKNDNHFFEIFKIVTKTNKKTFSVAITSPSVSWGLRGMLLVDAGKNILLPQH